MSQAGGSIADAAKAGGLVAISLFLILYFIMLQSADGITEVVNIFERTLLTIIPYCTLEISSTDGMGLAGLDYSPVDCAFL